MEQKKTIKMKLDEIIGTEFKKEKIEALEEEQYSGESYFSAHWVALAEAKLIKPEIESRVGQLHGYLRIMQNSEKSKIFMVLDDEPRRIYSRGDEFQAVYMKYIYVESADGSEYFVSAFDDHKGLAGNLSEILDSQKKIMPRYEKQYKDDPFCGIPKDAKVHGGLLELKFDEKDKPYVELFGRSGTFGQPDADKVLSYLKRTGIAARYDESRSEYTQQ